MAKGVLERHSKVFRNMGKPEDLKCILAFTREMMWYYGSSKLTKSNPIIKRNCIKLTRNQKNVCAPAADHCKG